MRKNWIWLIVLVIIVGGIAGVLFNRFFIPWLSELPGLSSLNKLESSNPVVINRVQEVSYNDGTNLADLSKQAAAYTVGIYSQSAGSFKFLANGIIASADGLIVSSKANLGGPGNYVILTNDGTVYQAALRALDPRSELAMLTINGSNLPVGQFAQASDLQPAQRVVYIGRSNKEFVRDFAVGYVTQTVDNNGSVDRVFYSEAFENSIQTDAKINSDFLGGPVLDLSGKIVGMVNSSQGLLIGEDLQTAVNSFLQSSKIVRPALGIKYNVISAAVAHLRSLSAAGIYIVSIDSGSPAAKAGLVAGDLITEVDGQPVPANSFEKLLNAHSMGAMSLTVIRAGQTQSITVQLEPK